MTVPPMSFVPDVNDKVQVRNVAAYANSSMSDVVRAIVRKFLDDHSIRVTVECPAQDILAHTPSTLVLEAVQSLTPYLDRTKS